jgi:hypothetical protein
MKTKEQIEAIVKAKNAYKKAARAISGRKPKVKGENTCPMWDDPKLQEKRAKRKAHLKVLAEARKEHFKLQTPNYPQFNKDNKLTTAQAKFNMMIIHMKQAKIASAKQSKEDKAKHKASLVAFKETYKRTYNTEPVDHTNCHRQKKNRGFARKSTAKIYQMKKVKLAA